ncbi:MAG TPA: DUF503 domain-containing protein, partial [Cryptosporangiaceae bacterium]|nr:DUF503 domain-containing protein [Cryptosporangiaceae bacterium]
HRDLRGEGEAAGVSPGGTDTGDGGRPAGSSAARLMFTGTLLLDVLLPHDSRSLKAKRAYVRPVVAALRRLEVAVAEVGGVDLHGRAEIGVASVSGDAGHLREVLDACERLVAARPELELLSVRRRLHSIDD